MRKIPSLFQRNYDTDRLVRDEVVPGSEWVLAGEGVATAKLDGTACLVKGGKLYKRYDAKKGKTPPPGWEPCEPEPDPKSGHWPGWVPVGEEPESRWHRAAWVDFDVGALPDFDDGTYELVGPHINGNPHRRENDILVRHGAIVLSVAPRDFNSLREYLSEFWAEGIVWHHPDGRMVKIKRKDFGHPWPPKGERS